MTRVVDCPAPVEVDEHTGGLLHLCERHPFAGDGPCHCPKAICGAAFAPGGLSTTYAPGRDMCVVCVDIAKRRGWTV